MLVEITKSLKEGLDFFLQLKMNTKARVAGVPVPTSAVNSYETDTKTKRNINGTTV